AGHKRRSLGGVGIIMVEDNLMVSETVELRGHIIDSLLLPRVLDEITGRGGRFEVEQLDVGRHREDPSYARIRIEAGNEEVLGEILRRAQEHGAEPVET